MNKVKSSNSNIKLTTTFPLRGPLARPPEAIKQNRKAHLYIAQVPVAQAAGAINAQ
jgi:hypothetical protein